LSPLSKEANDPPAEPPNADFEAPPNPANPDPDVEEDLAANPPNPPEMFPTEGVALPNADAEGVDGFPNAEEPNPVEPKPDAMEVEVVETGLENALGVPVPLVFAGVEVGVVEDCRPKADDEPNAVAGLMNELVVAVV
jgi:hypothetical protein